MKRQRMTQLKLLGDMTKISNVSSSYKEAANWLSQIIYKRGKPGSPNALHHEFYGTIRQKFQLPSQLTCSLFKHVVASYRSMKSNKKWKLAIYKKPTIPICWKRDFNLSKIRGLTIWKDKFQYKSRKLPEGKWCDSKLKLINNQWYLFLTIEVDVPEPKQSGTIVGIDSGQKNLLTAVDKKSNKTLYVSGNRLNHKRLCIRQTRAKVASVGTPSAKRLLKRLSGKEKAVTQEMLHLASKQVVTFAESVNAKVVVMEDLTGIRKNKKTHRKQRARNNRWPFKQCQFYIAYKAESVGIAAEHVNPAHTSQSCPCCGHTEKANRNGLKFRCKSCGYQDNADRVGGLNISLRSLFQRQAAGRRAMCQLAYSSDEGHQVQSATNLQI
tara:strand:- start:1134 stop:2279 length:1146 start_codon:yes stop_codon:yes gene_type:complete